MLGRSAYSLLKAQKAVNKQLVDLSFPKRGIWMLSTQLIELEFLLISRGQGSRNNNPHQLHKVKVMQFRALVPCHPGMNLHEEAPKGCVAALLCSFLFQDREISLENLNVIEKMASVTVPGGNSVFIEEITEWCSTVSAFPPGHFKHNPQNLAHSTSYRKLIPTVPAHGHVVKLSVLKETPLERTCPSHGLSWEGSKFCLALAMFG